MYCANCGKEFENGKAFCPYCGSPKSQNELRTAYCQNCGTPVTGNESFCANCGTALNQCVQQPALVTKPKKSKRGLAAVFAAVVVCAVAAVCFFMMSGSGHKSYEAVLDDYVKAVETLDGEKISSLLHEDLVSVLKNVYGLDNDQISDMFTSVLQEMVDDWDDDYDNWKLDYEISYKYEIDDFDISEYTALMDDDGNLDVDECVMVVLDINVISDGETVYTHNINLNIVKIDNSWYLWP